MTTCLGILALVAGIIVWGWFAEYEDHKQKKQKRERKQKQKNYIISNREKALDFKNFKEGQVQDENENDWRCDFH